MTNSRPACLRALLLLALVLSGASACGQDVRELTPADHKAVSSFTSSFAQHGMSRKDAHCVSTGWVRTVTARTMVRQGMLEKGSYRLAANPPRPSRLMVRGYVDAYFNCVDYGRQEARTFAREEQRVQIDTPSFARCANRIPKALAKQAMTDDLLQRNTRASTEVTHRLLSCAGV